LTLEAMIPPKICAVSSRRNQRHSARPSRCVIVLFSGRASAAAHQGLSLLSTALQNPEFADDFEDNRLAAPEAKNLIPVDQD
jgi:hypothetical protein